MRLGIKADDHQPLQTLTPTAEEGIRHEGEQHLDVRCGLQHLQLAQLHVNGLQTQHAR